MTTLPENNKRAMRRTLIAFGPILLFLASLPIFVPAVATAQSYYYPGGRISAHDLRRARVYKKGTYLLQGAKNRGILWIPKYSARGNRYLELVLEHFLQGAEEIHDFSPIQIGTLVGGSHGTASVLALLMDVEARELLGITKEQGEKLNNAFTEFRAQLAERMKELQRANPRASELQVILARTAEIERLSVLLEAQLELILSPAQFRRSKEMVFQLYGGFNTPVVDLGILSLFDLTRPQRERLELIAEDANRKRDKVFSAPGGAQLAASDMQAFDAALGEVTVVISRKVREVMTSEQLKRGENLMAQTEQLKIQLGLGKD